MVIALTCAGSSTSPFGFSLVCSHLKSGGTSLSPDPLCKYQEFTHGPSMDLGSSAGYSPPFGMRYIPLDQT